MIYGYARVSTTGQAINGNSLYDQEEQLRSAGATEIVSEAYSGASDARPRFNELISRLVEGDTLVVTKLDRFSRSLKNGIESLDELMNRGIKVHILNMGLLDNTPTGKLIRNILLSFAEFERATISERTRNGKAIKRATDPSWKEGRKRIEIDGFSEKFQKTKRGEISVTQACRELGISRRTWYNRVEEIA